MTQLEEKVISAFAKKRLYFYFYTNRRNIENALVTFKLYFCYIQVLDFRSKLNCF